MTDLVECVIARLRELPPETQNEIAGAMLVLVDDASEPIALTPEERASLARSLERAARGEFASHEEIEAIRAKYASGLEPPPIVNLLANLLADLPATPQPDEIVDLLARTPQARIERIVSTGQASPPGFWYDQPWDEWVVLLTGAARLLLDGEPEPRSLGPGDHLMIPAHLRHRVEWTSPDAPTVWLAVHLRPVGQPSTSTESPS